MTNIDRIITELLRQRGITRQEDIDEFLSTKPQKMYDPFLLLNMKAGVDLIVYAVKNNMKICIYGDYDADGITATTLMMDALSTVTDNIMYYIPSRFEEGYGLNKDAIDVIKQADCQLIITVDCGSVSYEEVEYAKSLGLEIMVTDHHSLNDIKADCILINPKQENCQYPFKDLAGCGVAFKVVQGLVESGLIDRSALVKSLDLVAIGTIGDVVPLIDENRTFAKYGIRSINMGLRPGLSMLLGEILPKQQKLNSDNISYSVVPHLNASGRMEDASIAVELLRNNRKNGEECDLHQIANRIISNNQLRKRTQDKAYEDCKKIVEKNYIDDSFIVIRADDIHEGIAGIVAGKVKEYYQRPAIIVTKSGDAFKGTGRSIEGLNLYNLLSRYSDLFIRFGGHAGACGFTMEEENLDQLRTVLIEEMNQLDFSDCQINGRWDMELEAKDISVQLAQGIEALAPFGNKNPKPQFLLKDVAISNLKFMGESNQHARFNIIDGNNYYNCVLFNKANEKREKLFRNKADVYGTIELQYWNGTAKPQFIVEEIE